MERSSNLIQRDGQVIWHPYTQHKTAAPPLPIISGKGIYLRTEDGQDYIDAISSWWTTIHGHAHPHIAEKIFEQASQLEHVIFAGFTHVPAIELAERILAILPPHFAKVFFSDNGSTAVEVALKMAVQYRLNKGEKRNKILAFKNAYHGDTFGAMSVSGRSVFTAAFQDFLFEVIFIDLPTRENLPAIKKQILENAADITAFIYEPLIQGAGGMLMYAADHMNELLNFIRLQDILCIADEVMTGFGRTGKIFASEYMHEQPDIICLSKGLTGGTMPLSLTVTSDKLYNCFLSEEATKTLFHGHSYTANPLACAAALASLDLLLDENCMQQIQMIQAQHLAFKKQLEKYTHVKNCRCTGTIIAFELEDTTGNYLSAHKQTIIQKALSQGVILRPLGNTIYIMPPYCITEKELQQVYAAVLYILES